MTFILKLTLNNNIIILQMLMVYLKIKNGILFIAVNISRLISYIAIVTTAIN